MTLVALEGRLEKLACRNVPEQDRRLVAVQRGKNSPI
jgi:hypothetical protein